MNRFQVTAFGFEPGEVDLHHELVKYFVDDQGVGAALNLTDRRVVIVMPEPQTGWLRRMRALFATRRIVIELRRETFARLELRGGRQWSIGTIVFHDLDGSILEVAVADPTLWKTRVERWLEGDVPPSPIPRAVLQSK